MSDFLDLIFYPEDKTLEIEHDREKIIYLLSGTNPILIPLRKNIEVLCQTSTLSHNYQQQNLVPTKIITNSTATRIKRLECCNLTFSESLRIV